MVMTVYKLNQYRMVVDLGENYGREHIVFRTTKPLDELKQDIRVDSDNIHRLVVDDADWIDDGQVLCVYAKVADSFNDFNRIRTFYKHEFKCDFGEEGYFTLDELFNHDLIVVKGFGQVDTEERKKSLLDRFNEYVQ